MILFALKLLWCTLENCWFNKVNENKVCDMGISFWFSIQSEVAIKVAEIYINSF